MQITLLHCSISLWTDGNQSGSLYVGRTVGSDKEQSLYNKDKQDNDLYFYAS